MWTTWTYRTWSHFRGQTPVGLAFEDVHILLTPRGPGERFERMAVTLPGSREATEARGAEVSGFVRDYLIRAYGQFRIEGSEGSEEVAAPPVRVSGSLRVGGHVEAGQGASEVARTVPGIEGHWPIRAALARYADAEMAKTPAERFLGYFGVVIELYGGGAEGDALRSRLCASALVGVLERLVATNPRVFGGRTPAALLDDFLGRQARLLADSGAPAGPEAMAVARDALLVREAAQEALDEEARRRGSGAGARGWG